MIYVYLQNNENQLYTYIYKAESIKEADEITNKYKKKLGNIGIIAGPFEIWREMSPFYKMQKEEFINLLDKMMSL